MKAFFLSDVHLNSGQEPKALALIRFLETLPNRGATDLFLVGDIFDLWVANHACFYERYANIIETLRQLASQGLRIYFFEGNHDLYLSGLGDKIPNIQVFEDAKTFRLGPFQVRVEHGDLINPGDRGYLFLRALLRNPIMELIAFRLPGKFVAWLGDRASSKSRHYTSGRKSVDASQTREMIRMHARRLASTEKFDILITGHVHLRDEWTFQSEKGPRLSINLGSWFHEPRVLELNSQGRAWHPIEISQGAHESNS